MKKIFLAAALTASFFNGASAENNLRQLTTLHQRLDMRFQDSPPLPAKKEILKKERLWGGCEIVSTKEHLYRQEIPSREEVLPYDPNRRDWYSQYPDREYLFEGRDRIRARYFAKTVDKFRIVKQDRFLAGLDLIFTSSLFGALGAGMGGAGMAFGLELARPHVRLHSWLIGGMAGVGIGVGIFMGYHLASKRIREGGHSHEEQTVVSYHK